MRSLKENYFIFILSSLFVDHFKLRSTRRRSRETSEANVFLFHVHKVSRIMRKVMKMESELYILLYAYTITLD